ncbi:MAG: nucleotidyltransferase domain-containing protein [Nanoarchaeota archaeon]|nr:nucleotidyltransferase domain-containing protein [Nanoarchaeota archaeon]
MKTKDIRSIKEKIKEYFFIHPTEKMRVRQLARALEAPLPSVIRYTCELKDEEILQIIEISNIKFYASNRESKKFLVEKTWFNIHSLLDSGLLDYLIKELGNPTMVLFGSYSRGEDIESSDIDIYIESSETKLNIENFEKILERKIQIFFYENIRKVPNPHLSNNIINGIKINGFLEVFK